jgi:hypothetical protein
MCGGGWEKKVHNRCYDYVSKNKKWIKLVVMPTRRTRAQSVIIDNELYVIGGSDTKDQPLSTCESLDLKTYTWKKRPDMLFSLIRPLVGAVGDNDWVVMNTDDDNKQARTADGILALQCYSTTTCEWSLKQPLPGQVTDTIAARALVVGHSLFIVGGDYKVCTAYNTHTDTWTLLSKPKYDHKYGPAALYKGRMLLMGGRAGWGGTNRIEEYSVDKDQWTDSDLPQIDSTWRMAFSHCVLLNVD